MGIKLKKLAYAVLALLVAVVTLLAGGVVTQAVQQNGLPGYYGNQGSSGVSYMGYHGFQLGPVAGSPGSYRYCIQAAVPLGVTDGDWQTVTDHDSVVAAQMVNKYKDNTDDVIQAAISYALHDHLDSGVGWTDYKNIMNANGLEGGDINAVVQRAGELWTEAENMTVTTAEKPQVKYTNGQRKGQIYVYLRNASGGYVSGVPYRIVYDSDMIKVDAKSGVTDGQPITVNWEALKTGTTKAYVQYDRAAARKLSPGTQTLFSIGDADPGSSPEVEFKISKGMKVTLGSDATKAYESGLSVNEVVKTEKGDRLKDTVTVNAVDQGNDGNDITDGLNHDINDWLTGNNGERVPINVKVSVYGAYTDEQAQAYRDKAKTGKQTVPEGATKIAEGVLSVSDSDTYTISTADKLKYSDGLTDETLPLGHYTFVWEAANSIQDKTAIEQATGSPVQNETAEGAEDGYPLLSDVTDGFFASREEVVTHNMRPTVSSSVTSANKAATETVIGSDGKSRPAIQVADGMVYREKSAPLRDNVTINVLDSNGDGKVDTYDWLHTAEARKKGDYSEDTQAPITIVGEYIASADQATYEKYLTLAKKGTVTSLPDGMKVYATTTFDVTKAGTYLVSNLSSDKPTSEWKAVDGESLDSLPSGYGTFRYRILNENQKNLSKSTGVAIAKDYPFAQDADDGYFTSDETIYTRFDFGLDSQASFNTVKVGETTGDKLIVVKTRDEDKWPTFARSTVVEGEEDSRELVPLKLQGYLVKLSDDPEYKVTETDKMPDNANIVHKTTLDNITSYGEYDTAAYTYNAEGTFAWYWQMEPDLTSANHLTNEAWRKLTHGLVNHQFGLASEIVRVTDSKTCAVTSKAQGKVKIENGKADLHDIAYLTDCAAADTIEFELWKQNAGAISNDTLIATTAKQNVDGKSEITSPTVTQAVESGDTYYWRELVRDTDGKPIHYGAARVESETVEIEGDAPVCEVSSKAQGKVTAKDGKADLYDIAYLNCAKATTIEFELWKQSEGDVSRDLRITVTQPQDATGKTEIQSHTVTQTVKDGDVYYWREITKDADGNVLSYGDARVADETVEIKVPHLAQTGVMVGGVFAVIGGLAGAGVMVNMAGLHGKRKRHNA